MFWKELRLSARFIMSQKSIWRRVYPFTILLLLIFQYLLFLAMGGVPCHPWQEE